MGVFKWLRRERVSITSQRSNPTDDINGECTAESARSPKNVGTIRTDEYKRDLAEFQARRSSGNKDVLETPNNKPKKKSARNSLPCTNCSSDLADTSFNYEKTSAQKYQKNKRRTSMEERVPNIQFLFSNQVFMPGNVFTRKAFSEVQHSKRMSARRCSPDFRVTRQKIDFEQEEHDQSITLTRREIFEERAGEHQTDDIDQNFELNQQIDFDVEDEPVSPPLFFKNNSLPFEVSTFLDASYSEDSVSEIENRDTSSLKFDALVKKKMVAENKSLPSNGDAKLEEVLEELRSFDQWADEQLRMQRSSISSKSGDSKCNSSYHGLPLVASSAVDMTEPETTGWSCGRWGVVPVHVKKLTNVTLGNFRNRQSVEVNILRKCRHPNIILLMGLYLDVHKNVHLICERFIATLHDVIHLKGRILSAQTAVSYSLDVASALVFLHMQGHVHTNLNSTNVMVTHSDVAKLTDLGSCVERTGGERAPPYSGTKTYPPEPIYVNLEGGRYSADNSDCRPLISANPSNATIPPTAVAKPYGIYEDSATFRWHPPELFQPDETGLVYPCPKSDVYALSLVLWECCNASMPWKTLSYEKLSDLYLVWKTGIRLPQDGTYPGCLLELLQGGLKLKRSQRMSLDLMVDRLAVVKSKLSDMEDILIPARITRKRSEFSSVAWELNSMSDVDSKTSTITNNHKAQIHREISDSSSHREEEINSQLSEKEYEIYEEPKRHEPERCYISESDDDRNIKVTYDKVPEREYSSNCSTPVAKKRVALRSIGTPGENLHKSDSTEYCSLFSPEDRNFLDVSKNEGLEKSSAQLCRSFTPRSYKPLHIKVPAVENLENFKALSKDNLRKGSYKFDIEDGSLPTTPIARSNKLRKNAWLSGDFNEHDKKVELRIEEDSDKTEPLTAVSATQITILHDKEIDNDAPQHNGSDECRRRDGSATNPESPSVNSECDTCGSLKRTAHGHEFSFDTCASTMERYRGRSHSWSFNPGSDLERANSTRPTDGALKEVNVKPLVEFHERWISEANKKDVRLMVPPDASRPPGPPVKPASHSVDTLQTSMPQLNTRRKQFRSNVTMSPTPSYNGRRGSQSEQYCSIRDKIGRSMSFPSRDPDRYEHNLWKKEHSKCMASMKSINQTTSSIENEMNQGTKGAPRSTSSLDDFIRQLIQKEFYQLLDQVTHENQEELVQKGTTNVLNAIKSDNENANKNNLTKSFSRVKINGNNKPLVQITFNRTGENSLQVLDSCVNVTICDTNTKIDREEEQYSSKDDLRNNSLKRCQAFSAIQEARSTEDLYIDDDLSTHMEENFCGNMKLIPLHGSLHEILCEKADDCCLVKVKQENGCDKVYFMCQNDGSKDSTDGCGPNVNQRDKVVFKRSISLIEERYERVYPKDRKPEKTVKRRPSKESIENKVASVNKRPKSEIIYPKVSQDPKVYSSSSPSIMCGGDKCSSSQEIVNIEHLMGYQDSSSDESVKSLNDDFEEIEKKIEEDFAMTASSKVGFLEKISEENLSVNGEISEKENHVSKLNEKLDLEMEFRKSKSCEELH